LGQVSAGHVGYLDGHIRKSDVREFFLDRSNHVLSALALLVPSFELVSFRFTGVTADWADIDHAVAKLNERTPHARETFQLREISQNKLGQLLVFLFPQPLYERVGSHFLAFPEVREPILGEAEVEEAGGRKRRLSQLFLLLDKI
jgi:hypothetical protein